MAESSIGLLKPSRDIFHAKVSKILFLTEFGLFAPSGTRVPLNSPIRNTHEEQHVSNSHDLSAHFHSAHIAKSIQAS